MPKKTIYVRDEDMPLFEQAMRKLGGEESMGSVIMDALRERLRSREKEEEQALRLAMIAQCPMPEILTECVEYRLQALPAEVVARTRILATAAYLEDPNHFCECNLYWDLDDPEWWKGANEKASLGRDKLANAAIERASQEVETQMLAEGFEYPRTSDKTSKEAIKRFGELLAAQLGFPEEQVKRVVANAFNSKATDATEDTDR